jgi:hypothetical protein
MELGGGSLSIRESESEDRPDEIWDEAWVIGASDIFL